MGSPSQAKRASGWKNQAFPSHPCTSQTSVCVTAGAPPYLTWCHCLAEKVELYATVLSREKTTARERFGGLPPVGCGAGSWDSGVLNLARPAPGVTGPAPPSWGALSMLLTPETGAHHCVLQRGQSPGLGQSPLRAACGHPPHPPLSSPLGLSVPLPCLALCPTCVTMSLLDFLATQSVCPSCPHSS